MTLILGRCSPPLVNLDQQADCYCPELAPFWRVTRQNPHGQLLIETYAKCNDDDGLAVSQHGNILVLVGRLVRNGVSLSAEECLKRVEESGLTDLLVSSGEYVLVCFEKFKSLLSVVSSPLASIPVYYHYLAGVLAFGPTASAALRVASQAPKIAEESCRQFLLNRYLLGRKTIFENVYRVMPGEMLEYNTGTADFQVRSFWDLKFTPKNIPNRTAIDSLYETLIKSCQQSLLLEREKSKYNIFLTGGLDSRGIMALSKRIGKLPSKAFTWGAEAKHSNSDPAIAAELAKLYGVPFRFIQIDGAEWPRHSRQWLTIDDLNSDNGNNLCTPLEYYFRQVAASVDFTVLGDECFGAGPLPVSVSDAIDNVFRTSLHHSDSVIGEVMNRTTAEQTRAEFKLEIERQIENCPNDHPKDIQDYLFFRNYIAKWIFAPGNFKLPVQKVVRPLMTLDVLNCVSEFSPTQRVDKSVYVDMLNKFFPELKRIRNSADDAGVNWRLLCTANGLLRDRLIELTNRDRLENTPLGGILDLELTAVFVNRFFANQAAPQRRKGRVFRHIYDLRRILSKSRFIAPFVGRIQPMAVRLLGYKTSERKTQAHQLILRIALLSQQYEQLNKLNL